MYTDDFAAMHAEATDRVLTRAIDSAQRSAVARNSASPDLRHRANRPRAMIPLSKKYVRPSGAPTSNGMAASSRSQARPVRNRPARKACSRYRASPVRACKYRSALAA